AAVWLGLLNPRYAVDRVAHASKMTLLLMFALHAALLVVGAIVLVMWEEAVDWTWRPAIPNAATGAVEAAGPVVRVGTIQDVWAEWHTAGVIGPAELAAASVLLALLLGTHFLAWLHLPAVHRAGSFAASYWRTYRAVVSACALVCILTLIPMSLVVWNSRTWKLTGRRALPGPGDMIDPLITAAAIIVGVVWVAAAVRRAAGPAAPPEQPPRCEGCGYDLTHVSSDDRCSECGLSASRSLTPGVLRPGAMWQQQNRVPSWLRTTVAALVQPTRFYAALQVRRTDCADLRFALTHYLLIALLAAAFPVAADTARILKERGPAGAWLALTAPSPQMKSLGALFSMVAPGLAYGAHLGIRAVATTIAWMQQRLPDTRQLAAASHYETVFAWIPLGFLGVFIGSFIIFGSWLRQIVGRAWGLLLPVPIEVELVFLTLAALLVVWFFRYFALIRGVRFGNF
ncbi:MAG: hypothetical protein AB7Q17_13050, partial [Phycisphaerae bacterium]